MPLCDERRAIDIARIGDLGGARVALEQNGLRTNACRDRAADQKDESYPPSFHVPEVTLLGQERKRSKRRSLRSSADQGFDQLDGVQQRRRALFIDNG